MPCSGLQHNANGRWTLLGPVTIGGMTLSNDTFGGTTRPALRVIAASLPTHANWGCRRSSVIAVPVPIPKHSPRTPLGKRSLIRPDLRRSPTFKGEGIVMGPLSDLREVAATYDVGGAHRPTSSLCNPPLFSISRSDEITRFRMTL